MPAYGLGNAGVRTNKDQVGAAPTVTAANDGLSLSGTTVQLGQAVGAVGDPAIFINDREIPMAGFALTMRDGANPVFIVDPDAAFPRYALGDIGQVNALSYLDIDSNAIKLACGGNGTVAIGDVDVYGTGLVFGIATGGLQPGFFMRNDGGDLYFAISFSNDTYFFGDGGNYVNGGRLLIHNDALETIDLGFSLNAQTGIGINNGGESISMSSTSGNGLILDMLAGTYQLGPDGSGNSTNLLIDDAGEIISFNNNGSAYGYYDFFSKDFLIQVGDLTATNEYAFIQARAPLNNGKVTLYGQDDAGTFAELSLEGGAEQITITAANGLKITGDTTLIRTGTALGNGAGAGAGTLANAPTAGDPTKWVPIDDNGTTRYIPTWT